MAHDDWVAGMCSSVPYSICFHAQQAAEKNLKAYLAARGQSVQKTHDLSSLLRTAASHDPSFTSLQVHAGVLAPFAVDIRYSESKALAESECKPPWDAMTFINTKVFEAMTELGLEAGDV